MISERLVINITLIIAILMILAWILGDGGAAYVR